MNPWDQFDNSLYSAQAPTTAPTATAPAVPPIFDMSAGGGRGSINPPQGSPPAQTAGPQPWDNFDQKTFAGNATPIPTAPTSAPSNAQVAQTLGNQAHLSDLPGAVLKSALDFVIGKGTAIAGDAAGAGTAALNNVVDYLGDAFGYTPEQTAQLKIAATPMEIRDKFQQAGGDIQRVADKAFTPQQNTVADIPTPVFNAIGTGTKLVGDAVGGATGSAITGAATTDALNFALVPKMLGGAADVLPNDIPAMAKAVPQGFRSTLSDSVWKDANGNDIAPPDFGKGKSKIQDKEQWLTDDSNNPIYFTNKFDSNGNRIPITSVYQSNQGMTTSKGPVGSYLDKNGEKTPSVQWDHNAMGQSAFFIANELAGGLIPGVSLLGKMYGFTKASNIRGAINENYKLNSKANAAENVDNPQIQNNMQPVYDLSGNIIKGTTNVASPTDNN